MFIKYDDVFIVTIECANSLRLEPKRCCVRNSWGYGIINVRSLRNLHIRVDEMIRDEIRVCRGWCGTHIYLPSYELLTDSKKYINV